MRQGSKSRGRDKRCQVVGGLGGLGWGCSLSSVGLIKGNCPWVLVGNFGKGDLGSGIPMFGSTPLLMTNRFCLGSIQDGWSIESIAAPRCFRRASFVTRKSRSRSWWTQRNENCVFFLEKTYTAGRWGPSGWCAWISIGNWFGRWSFWVLILHNIYIYYNDMYILIY